MDVNNMTPEEIEINKSDRQLERLSAIKTAFYRARFYWYGLQLDARQAELFQKGIDVLSQEILND